jgi:hypothetical protein
MTDRLPFGLVEHPGRPQHESQRLAGGSGLVDQDSRSRSAFCRLDPLNTVGQRFFRRSEQRMETLGIPADSIVTSGKP